MTDCPIKRLTFYGNSHSYYVVTDDNPRAVRFSGASSYGKQIESTDALARWKVVNSLMGASKNPTLLRRFAMATERREQDAVIEALMNEAKANEGRDFGSDAHRATELHDKGVLDVDDDWTGNIVARWKAANEAAAIEIDAALVERIVINPEMKVCATFDRIARYQGEAHVVDLKTSASGVRYAHTMCVQLALIANAPWITSGPGERKGDGLVWETFEPAPPVNRQRGLIVSMPIDSADVEVWELNIDAGWRAAQLAWQARQWCATKPANLVASASLTVGTPAPLADTEDLLAGYVA